MLIDGGKTFRDFIRANKESQKLIKKLIAQVSGVAVPIGPMNPRQSIALRPTPRNPSASWNSWAGGVD
ncbi:hypothetical protein [Faecalibacterium prausnitzii]|uniref:hypothetical protein n=1 Tax=Faecalibacterium prausnitzii TaxID=853 RepID=UPI001CBB4919|nr:hypothetical protein [Faecalibacterium prausnitzii]